MNKNNDVEIIEYEYYDLEWLMLSDLKGNELKVFYCLKLHKNKNHSYSFPSIETIANETAMSPRTVSTAIKSLKEKGWIAIGKMKCKQSDVLHRNTYTLLKIAKAKAKKSTDSFSELEDLAINSREDKYANKKIIEGKLGITLTKWQSFISTKMDTGYLLQAVGTYIKKKGRKFSFLIDLYTDLLCANNLFSKELANLFKVQWTGNKEDNESRIESIKSRDMYEQIMYGMYTEEQINALRNGTYEETYEEEFIRRRNNAFDNLLINC